jgi:hypothetical protein
MVSPSLGIDNRPITEKDRDLLDLRNTDKEIKIIKVRD